MQVEFKSNYMEYLALHYRYFNIKHGFLYEATLFKVLMYSNVVMNTKI